VGQNKRSLDIINSQIRYFSSAPKGKGRLFGLYLAAGNGYLTIGDLDKAKSYFQRNNALYAESRSWPNVEMYRSSWLSNVEEGNARMFDSSGRFADAEKAFHRAVEQMKDAVIQSTKWPNKPAGGILETIVDVDHAFEGRAKARQARMAEAEVDMRQALLASLGRVGKYHPDTALILSLLTGLLMEQGRYPEAEHLARATIDIYRGMGYPEDASWLINSQIVLATLMNFQRRRVKLRRFTLRLIRLQRTGRRRRDAIVNNNTRVAMMISTGNAADAVEIAKRAVERTKGQSGAKSFDTERARGFLAFALARAGRDKEAYDEFREAIPVLLDYSNLASNNDENQDASSGARDRTRTLVEVLYRLVGTQPLAVEGCRRGNLSTGRCHPRSIRAARPLGFGRARVVERPSISPPRANRTG
jgi:tetratricopeptide (TPR) repeat protein